MNQSARHGPVRRLLRAARSRSRKIRALITNRPSAEERVLRRLDATDRYQAGRLTIGGWDFTFPDAPSFAAMYREIFLREIYRIDSLADRPTVIDGGGNIGLSAVYFSRLFPTARIRVFEPDPAIFRYLQENTRPIAPDRIVLEQSALWTFSGELEFESEGADSGRIGGLSSSAMGPKTKISCVRLRDYLQEPVEFLKLDVEGAESEIIEDCRPMLRNVRNAFVEYHGFEGKPQRLAGLLSILQEVGFRVHVEQALEMRAKRPLLERNTYHGMDTQLNLFAFRPNG